MSKKILIGMLLLTGCVETVKSGTINLCNNLPSVSVKDTDQTIIEVDNFNAKYKAAYCNG